MKATYTTAAYSRKREVLQDVIPLEAPFWICADPSSICNICCKYCLQFDMHTESHPDFYRGFMSFELAKKIVDDLKEFERQVKVVSWYGWGEPLLNPDFSRMIAYARKSEAIGSVETITNGILLEPELCDKLIDAGLQRINISVQALTSDGYYDVCGKKVDIERFAKNIQYLYEHKSDDLIMYIKIPSTSLKHEGDREKFFEIFGNICDEIFVEQIVMARSDSASNINIPNETAGVFGQDIKEHLVCPYLFYRMFIRPDGKCCLCNGDWYRSEAVGDLNKESLRSIWHGERIRHLQILHLQGKRKEISLCAKCGLVNYYPIDNLDPYADIILKRMCEE